MKNIFKIYILPILMISIVISVWIGAGFFKKSLYAIAGIFQTKLQFKINPSKNGGNIAVNISDKIGDNKDILPPENKIFLDAYDSTDIISYTVHYPVKNILDNNYSWNIDMELKYINADSLNPNLFGLIKGSIYIDLDNDNNGGEKSFYDTENIKFSDDFKWDYYIEFDYMHKEGKMFCYENKYSYPVKILFNNNIIRLSLPVIGSISKRMDKKSMGRHIAAIGLYSPFEDGNLILLNEKPGQYNSGAGKNFMNLSPYYDFVCSKINKDSNTIAPIEISKYSENIKIDGIDEITKKLEELSKKGYNSVYYKIENKELEEAISLFNEKKYIEAENIFTKLANNASSIANTYLARIRSDSANKAKNVGKKMDYIKSAYDYYYWAERLIANDNDRYIMLVYRIGLSLSVPDEIFHKLDLAEKDINRLMKLEKLSIEEKAYYYLKLIEILKLRNKIRELRIIIEDIKKIV